LANRIELKASHQFSGTIWNTLTNSSGSLLFLEIRNEHLKKVSFSAYQVKTGTFLWKDVSFDEPWWISLAATAGDVLIFTIYTDTNNPDKKSILAYDINQQTLLWWKNDFSLTDITKNEVIGTESKFGLRKVVLDIISGEPKETTDYVLEQNFSVVRPLQYNQNTAHFDTVKLFLERKFSISPVNTIEYLEYETLVLISSYNVEQEGLANNLFVLTSEGTMLLHERIGERLKGIGVDTFFILSGYLIFVKNKCELVSYKTV
jgi:hypothetical protein